MVEDVAALGLVRPDRHGLDPPIRGDRVSRDLCLRHGRPGGGPLVHPVGHDVVEGGLEDRVGRPQLVLELPSPLVRPDDRLGEVGRVAERRAGVDPVHDRADLLVTERGVILVLGDPDGPVDRPRRHLALDQPLPDQGPEGPDLLVSLERHRGDAPRPVARDAVLLDDRRDVPRVRQVRTGIVDHGHVRRVLVRVLRTRVPDQPCLGGEGAGLDGQQQPERHRHRRHRKTSSLNPIVFAHEDRHLPSDWSRAIPLAAYTSPP